MGGCRIRGSESGDVLVLLDGAAGLGARELRDSLWLNGSVPIALQRWELLGLADEIDGIGPVS
jgi:hypothetical protein